MPFLEVVYAKVEPLSKEQKKAFVEDAVEILAEVISTRPSGLRLAFQHVEPADSILLLEEGEAE